MNNNEKLATISILNQIKDKCAHYLNPDERTALLLAMECVKNQGKPEWIPIGEAMPENSCLDKVLVHVEGAGAIVTNYFDGFNRTPGCKQYEFTDVEAWMYVPEYEPPKSRQTAEGYLEEVGGEIGASSAAFIQRMTGKGEA